LSAPFLRPLRVGSVPYLVGRPLDSGLEHESGIEYSRAVPSELVRALRNGLLDVALVSSIELFRQPGYRYLDGLAIAGRGRVSSVQVFLRRPIEAVRTLALDPASRTSAALVGALIAERTLETREVALGEDPRGLDCDAWLRIGDAALIESEEAPRLERYNPSEAYCQATGLPFVFAAWIVRAGVELSAEQLAAFARARRRGSELAPALAREKAAELGLSTDFVRAYLLEECCFELGTQEFERSLKTFRDLAAARQGADASLEPRALVWQDLQS
jgi:chorismate dehydratase